MDWDRAKNYTIVLFVFLNLFLFICNIWFDKRYVIDDGNIDSIKSILSKKNIELAADIPRDYKPMVQINFNDCVYDTINLQKVFFAKNEDVKRISDFEKQVLTSENEKITIFNYAVEFEKQDLSFNGIFNRENLLNISNSYVEKLSEFYDGLKLYNINFINNECIIEYVQKYRNEDIFNNYVKFRFKNDGSMNVKFKYFPVKSMYGEAVNICSADEALFIFAGSIEKTSKKITITGVKRGYYFGDSEKGGNVVSVPHYRIETAESETPFFVNAYDGGIEK